MLLPLYRTALRLSTPLLEAHLKARARKGREDPARAHERRGCPVRARGDATLVWFHAASVWESLSILSVVDRILKGHPDFQVMVTTGTVNSAALMEKRLPKGAFHQYIPVDHPDWVTRFLDHWRPDLCLWMESELWPNILLEIRRRGTPAILLNARMSERSFKRWTRAKGTMKQVLSAFSLCLAQNAAEAGRLRHLGAQKVKVAANLKYAARPLPCDGEKLAALKSAIGARSLVLWASTHPGEEEVALRLHTNLSEVFLSSPSPPAPKAWVGEGRGKGGGDVGANLEDLEPASIPPHPPALSRGPLPLPPLASLAGERGKKGKLLTIIVPRHPARGKDIEALCEEAGFKVSLRSDGALPEDATDIYIADTMGELGLFYTLSKLAIVGGSFADIGGHNPIEPGQAGCVIFCGPVMYNFITISADFESRNAALRLKDESDLARHVRAFLDDPASFAPMARAAQEWTRSQSGVLDALMDDLAPFLEKLKETRRTA